MEEALKRFLNVSYGDGSGYGSGYGSSYGSRSGSGYGDGDGSGYGYGSSYGSRSGYGCGSGSGYGYGDGSGYGSGYGDGDGDGDGYGYGYGSGSGLKFYDNKPVYYIDDMPTLINSVHGTFARGEIVNDDLSSEPCFVAKCGNYFAHGATLREAVREAQDKYFDDLPVDDKITALLAEVKPGVKYPARLFYGWHHKLTGSCAMGRDAFVRNHGIDIETAEYTVEEFIALTENDYGGSVIKQLKERLEG